MQLVNEYVQIYLINGINLINLNIGNQMLGFELMPINVYSFLLVNYRGVKTSNVKLCQDTLLYVVLIVFCEVWR